MDTQKKKFDKNKILAVRLSLTFIFSLAFMLAFFLCGGLNYLLGNIGENPCFFKEDFEVHFISVGQGDAAFLRFPDKTTMLIDAGRLYSSQVCDYLDDIFMQESIKQIDYFVITHPDADHTGGAVEVFEKFKVVNFYRPMVLSTYEVENFGNSFNYNVGTTITYDNVIYAAYQEGCTINFNFAGVSWGDENYSVRFLSPTKTNYGKNDTNSYSPFIRIDCHGKSFLFTGDAQFDSEQEVIEASPNLLDVDVLKVAHHGSKNATSSDFLKYVSPEYAIISAGTGYGHPNAETLARLAQTGCKVYVTSVDGSVALTVKNGQFCFDGYTNNPTVDFTIIVTVFVFGILIVWGVKFSY